MMATSIQQARTKGVRKAAGQAPRRDAVRGSISIIAGGLQELLGQKLTAVIAGVSDARAVGDWARGTRKPHPKAEERLRHAYQIAKLLEGEESRETVRAWFIGMNPDLDDHPPALVIADEPVRVLQAARAFLTHG